MEITDRAREKDWLEFMNITLIFVCNTCFCVLAELISCPGRIVRGFLDRFPHRTSRSSRTGPHGYYTGCSNLPNANDA